MVKCKECEKAFEHLPPDGICEDCRPKAITQGVNRISIAIVGLFIAFAFSPRTYEKEFLPTLGNAAAFLGVYLISCFIFSLVYTFVLPYLSKKLLHLPTKAEDIIFISIVVVISILWAVI